MSSDPNRRGAPAPRRSEPIARELIDRYCHVFLPRSRATPWIRQLRPRAEGEGRPKWITVSPKADDWTPLTRRHVELHLLRQNIEVRGRETLAIGTFWDPSDVVRFIEFDLDLTGGEERAARADRASLWKREKCLRLALGVGRSVTQSTPSGGLRVRARVRPLRYQRFRDLGKRLIAALDLDLERGFVELFPDARQGSRLPLGWRSYWIEGLGDNRPKRPALEDEIRAQLDLEEIDLEELVRHLEGDESPTDELAPPEPQEDLLDSTPQANAAFRVGPLGERNMACPELHGAHRRNLFLYMLVAYYDRGGTRDPKAVLADCQRHCRRHKELLQHRSQDLADDWTHQMTVELPRKIAFWKKHGADWTPPEPTSLNAAERAAMGRFEGVDEKPWRRDALAKLLEYFKGYRRWPLVFVKYQQFEEWGGSQRKGRELKQWLVSIGRLEKARNHSTGNFPARYRLQFLWDVSGDGSGRGRRRAPSNPRGPRPRSAQALVLEAISKARIDALHEEWQALPAPVRGGFEDYAEQRVRSDARAGAEPSGSRPQAGATPEVRRASSPAPGGAEGVSASEPRESLAARGLAAPTKRRRSQWDAQNIGGGGSSLCSKQTTREHPARARARSAPRPGRDPDDEALWDRVFAGLTRLRADGALLEAAYERLEAHYVLGWLDLIRADRFVPGVKDRARFVFGKLWRAIRAMRAGAKPESLPRDFTKAQEALFAERVAAHGLPGPAGETRGASPPQRARSHPSTVVEGLDPQVREVLEDLGRCRGDARLAALSRLRDLGAVAAPALPILDRLARDSDRVVARYAEAAAHKIRSRLTIPRDSGLDLRGFLADDAKENLSCP